MATERTSLRASDELEPHLVPIETQIRHHRNGATKLRIVFEADDHSLDDLVGLEVANEPHIPENLTHDDVADPPSLQFYDEDLLAVLANSENVDRPGVRGVLLTDDLTVLIATPRMVGRLTASQMASASRRSFLFVLT